MTKNDNENNTAYGISELTPTNSVNINQSDITYNPTTTPIWTNGILNRIEKLQEMQNTENKGKYSTSSTDNPYISMYNDVPTKNSEWYKHMLALS